MSCETDWFEFVLLTKLNEIEDGGVLRIEMISFRTRDQIESAETKTIMNR